MVVWTGLRGPDRPRLETTLLEQTPPWTKCVDGGLSTTTKRSDWTPAREGFHFIVLWLKEGNWTVASIHLVFLVMYYWSYTISSVYHYFFFFSCYFLTVLPNSVFGHWSLRTWLLNVFYFLEFFFFFFITYWLVFVCFCHKGQCFMARCVQLYCGNGVLHSFRREITIFFKLVSAFLCLIFCSVFIGTGRMWNGGFFCFCFKSWSQMSHLHKGSYQIQHLHEPTLMNNTQEMPNVWHIQVCTDCEVCGYNAFANHVFNSTCDSAWGVGQRCELLSFLSPFKMKMQLISRQNLVSLALHSIAHNLYFPKAKIWFSQIDFKYGSNTMSKSKSAFFS